MTHYAASNLHWKQTEGGHRHCSSVTAPQKGTDVIGTWCRVWWPSSTAELLFRFSPFKLLTELNWGTKALYSFSWYEITRNSAWDNRWPCVHRGPSVLLTVPFLWTYYLRICTFRRCQFLIHLGQQLPWAEDGVREPQTAAISGCNMKDLTIWNVKGVFGRVLMTCATCACECHPQAA